MNRTVRGNGRTYNITGWKCKFDGREGCRCCEPKNSIHPSAVGRPGIREFSIPFEFSKSRAHVKRFRSGFDGSSKSKYKR